MAELLVSEMQLDSIDQLYQEQKQNLQTLKEESSKDRKSKINKFIGYLSLKSNQDLLVQAMRKDFGKSKAEVLLTEILPSLSQARYVRKNLSKWMLDQGISMPLSFTGLKAKISYEPKGQALIIAPWNYPFYLAAYPLIYAIAAGCSVILKPSELTPHTAAFIEKMIGSIFTPNEVAVVQGAIPETTKLLEKEWGHIFFTGSTQVGCIIMKAASKTLSSVSLELGGKSPCIIDESANLNTIIPRMIWGKYVNGGQTCIAPDYILVHESKHKEFLKRTSEEIIKRYGSDIQNNPDFPKIISHKHTQRLIDILNDSVNQGARIIAGGDYSLDNNFIAPTLLDKVTTDMAIMQEEIFGPLLPVLVYSKASEVIEIINSMSKPLSFYICSRKNKNINYFLNNTSSGGALINEFLLGPAIPSVPFGGIGKSGIGKAYGKHGFIEFSNEKPILRRRYLDFRFVFPPYNHTKERLISFLSKWV